MLPRVRDQKSVTRDQSGSLHTLSQIENGIRGFEGPGLRLGLGSPRLSQSDARRGLVSARCTPQRRSSPVHVDRHARTHARNRHVGTGRQAQAQARTALPCLGGMARLLADTTYTRILTWDTLVCAAEDPEKCRQGLCQEHFTARQAFRLPRAFAPRRCP